MISIFVFAVATVQACRSQAERYEATEDLREPEVHELEAPGLREHDVRGLEVAVDYVAPMFVLTFILTLGYFSATFERPVLGCIEAEFCKT